LQSNDIKMTARSVIGRIVQQEDINFLLTNRLPRRWLTQIVGWLSRIEHPWVCGACMSLWRVFSDLDLSDAKQSRFRTLHECFTRELKVGARPIETDPAVLASPCDAIVGACGRVEAGSALQAKGFSYRVSDLLGDAELRKGEEMGWFEHGSTIIVLAPPGISLCREVFEGSRIRMGQALMRLEEQAAQGRDRPR
jgi:phosphatidylserine decarboxylase